MLSEENKALREGSSLCLESGIVLQDDNLDELQDLDREDLMSLVISYAQKVKVLSSEVSANSQKHPSRDKYKQLARRLKEERNQYRDAIQEKM